MIEEEELEGTYEFIKRIDFNKISVERVASKGFNKRNNTKINNIVNEKNRRIFKDKIDLFFDELNNLPWG